MAQLERPIFPVYTSRPRSQAAPIAFLSVRLRKDSVDHHLKLFLEIRIPLLTHLRISRSNILAFCAVGCLKAEELKYRTLSQEKNAELNHLYFALYIYDILSHLLLVSEHNKNGKRRHKVRRRISSLWNRTCYDTTGQPTSEGPYMQTRNTDSRR